MQWEQVGSETERPSLESWGHIENQLPDGNQCCPKPELINLE
jgi:hypothetical protein